MEMTMKTRKELTKTIARRYQKAGWHAKSTILTEFCLSTGFNRDYAATLLRSTGKTTVSAPRKKRKGTKRSGRPPRYGEDIKRIINLLWKQFDKLCSKRFVVLLRTILPRLCKDKFLAITPAQAEKLNRISAATANRLLAESRKEDKLHGHCYTRATDSLKDSIPVRTFGEWQGVPPGHFQIDTVGHDGGMLSTDCAFSLCLTDVCLGWTERYAMQNRAFKWVSQGLTVIQKSVPYSIAHLHPDNGSEFINYGLVDWCQKQQPVIDLSRSRPNKKNDNCYVEQKNFDTIRKLVGYARYSSQEMLETLNELYRVHGQLLNYFYPSQKLLAKTRVGSKIKKVYDAPRSPADRLLEHPSISDEVKRAVRAKRSAMDPLALSNTVDVLTERLLKMLVEQNTSVVQQSNTH
jgi:hypothetical protein